MIHLFMLCVESHIGVAQRLNQEIPNSLILDQVSHILINVTKLVSMACVAFALRQQLAVLKTGLI